MAEAHPLPKDTAKRTVATEISVFDFELFISILFCAKTSKKAHGSNHSDIFCLGGSFPS
jgi:hypothetical protein